MVSRFETGIVHFHPYMASTEWYSAYLQGRLKGYSDSESTALANFSVETYHDRKNLFRTTIAGTHGQSPMLLSVPILGGSRKGGKSGPPELSQHGRWQAIHLGAIKAGYGGSPFFPHIYPSLERILKNRCGEFATMSEELHQTVLRIMALEENIDGLRVLESEDLERFIQLKKDKSKGVIQEMSVFDVIFRKGREAIFSLLPYSHKVTYA